MAATTGNSNIASSIPRLAIAAAALLPYLVAAQASPAWTPAPPANTTIPVAMGKDGDEVSVPIVLIVCVVVVLVIVAVAIRICCSIRNESVEKKRVSETDNGEESLLSVVSEDGGNNYSFGRSSSMGNDSMDDVANVSFGALPPRHRSWSITDQPI